MPFTVRIDGKIPALDKVPAAIQRAAMPDIVAVVAAKARELAPRRTGELAGSIDTVVQRAGERGIVRAKAPHAHLVHNGTKPHPVTGKALPIPTAEGIIFRRMMTHPGTKANPFLTNALEQVESDIERILGRRGQDALDKVAQ
jgi:HK97 gp10 family phage protein